MIFSYYFFFKNLTSAIVHVCYHPSQRVQIIKVIMTENLNLGLALSHIMLDYTYWNLAINLLGQGLEAPTYSFFNLIT